MSNNSFQGIKVYYLDGEPVTVDSISGGYINIKHLNRIRKLSYPSAFFEIQGRNPRRKFLSTDNQQLIQKVKTDASDNLCSICRGYFEKYELSEQDRVCEKCEEEIITRNVKCAFCGETVLKKECKLNINGRLICKNCYDLTSKSKTIDFTEPRSNPMVYLFPQLPKKCREHQNKVTCLRARVNCFNRFTEKTTAETIDLLYCEECDMVMSLYHPFRIYAESFGRILVQIDTIKGAKEYWGDSFRLPYAWDFNNDSLLSRWGYIAQEKQQSKKERRMILDCILKYVPGGKVEIERLLNGFIENRSARCPYATPIWEDDLRYVLSQNLDEPVIDLV